MAGIYSVKSDMKAQTLTVDGTIEPEKLIKLLRKKVHKQAEIIASKPDKKDEKKEKDKGNKDEEKKDKEQQGKSSTGSESKDKDQQRKSSTSSESTKIVDIDKEGIKVVEVKAKDSNAPYFVHYVYAPQLFSDENPNACCIV